MNKNSNHNGNDGLLPQAHGQPVTRGRCNRCGNSRIRLVVAAAFVALAFLVAAPSLVGMVRAKPVDAVGWITNFTEGQVVAKRDGKPIILKFTADWCGPCRMLTREVFSDSQVGQFVQGAFVPVIVDVTDRHGANQSIANQYQVDALPTLVVLNPDGQEQARKVGYLDKPVLLSWLEPYGLTLPANTPSVGGIPSRIGIV